MGYSVNPEVLEARIAAGMFTQLAHGKACQWKPIATMVATKRYLDQIHEGLYIASLYPDRFPELARAKKNFRLHLVRPGLIEAKPKTDAGAVVSSSEPAMPTVSTVGCVTAEDVISAWRDHMPSLDPINFQQHRLDALELEALYDWCERHEPRLMILAGEGHLTLSLRVPFHGIEDPSWKPPVPTPPLERDYDLD